MNGWINVDDRLPDNEDYILLANAILHDKFNYDCSPAVGYYDLEEEKFFTADDQGLIVTHWQPLPDPPETEK